MSGGALVCDKKKKEKKTSRARIVFFVRLVRARFVIAKPAASSIKWTMMTMMMMGRRATGARETKMSIRRLRVGVKDERLGRSGSFTPWRETYLEDVPSALWSSNITSDFFSRWQVASNHFCTICLSWLASKGCFSLGACSSRRELAISGFRADSPTLRPCSRLSWDRFVNPKTIVV